MIGGLQMRKAASELDGFLDGFVWLFITDDGNERDGFI